MTTNTTSMTVSNLTQGAEYSFTVAGVNAEVRVGEESVPSELATLDNECLCSCNITVTDRAISSVNNSHEKDCAVEFLT